jgi:hypothetical protein
MDLKDNSAIPVTDAQIKAFTIWVKERYPEGRGEYELALRNKRGQEIPYYFAMNIFSEEMREAYYKADPYLDKPLNNQNNNNLDIALIQLYRRRLDIKISRTSDGLLRHAFPKSKDDEQVSVSLQVQRHTEIIRNEHYWQFQGRIMRHTILHNPTATEASAYIPSSCGICLSVHAMMDTCVTKCGHEFGTKCLKEWYYTTCPTCSEFCYEVTEFCK